MSGVLDGTPPSLLSLDLAIIDYHKGHLTMYVMLHGIDRDEPQDHLQ